MPDFTLEQNHDWHLGRRVVGIDEAGRGPWAGPVAAAAVWFDPAQLPQDPEGRDLLDRLDDSKKLTAARREALFEVLTAHEGVAWAIAEASVAEIDERNILQATLGAMAKAVAGLPFTPDLALVDGNRCPTLPCPAEAVVRGDGRSLSIAAASILAKVSRDRTMAGLAADCPGYGWERNAGYGTAEHRAGLARLGITVHHRRSYRPIRALLEQQDSS